MRFIHFIGDFCQTVLWRSSQSFLNVTSRIHNCPQNRMGNARPQHREFHALLFTDSVWIPALTSHSYLRVVRRDLRLIVLIREDLKV